MYIKMTIKGTRPLMLHNPTLVDSKKEITKAYKKLTAKRGKTEEDQDAISELEFRAGLYLDSQGPYFPGRNLKAALQHGGKKSNKGKAVRQAVDVMETNIPLIYDGPRDWKSLFNESRKTIDGDFRPYVHIEQVKVEKSRITRTRPIFRQWALAAHLHLDLEDMDCDVLKGIATTLGEKLGIGELRPDYGRFELVEFVTVSEAEALAVLAR